MDTQKLLELAFQSPVLVALIYGVVAIVGGRWLLRWKDEQIKTKDAQIATLKEAHAAQLKVKDDQIANLEQWMPASMFEQLEALQKIKKMQLEAAEEKIDLLTNQTISEQEKRQQLEVEYRGQIETFTKQLKTASEVERQILVYVTSNAVRGRRPPSELKVADLHNVIHEVTAVEAWSQLFTEQWAATARKFLSENKDGPTDKNAKSDSEEGEAQD